MKLNISVILNLFKSKEAKSILENFISLSAIQLIGMVLPLITLPYILRTIGFESYGIIVFAASLIAYFQSLTDFSFRITAVRDVAIFKNSQRKLDLIYSKVIFVKGIFLLISLLIITIIVLCVPSFYDYKDIYILSSLMLVGYALFPEWFFQGIEKMRYITYLNLGIKIFFTICIFVFIKDEKDYWIYPLLQGAGLIGAGVVGQLMLIYKYKLKFIFLPKKVIANTIKVNFPIFVNQFVPTLYNNTSSFLLGIIAGSYSLGIYDAIKKIIDLAISLIGILSRVFFPYLNRNKNAFRNYRRMMLVILFSLCFVILCGYKFIFWYLDVKYVDAFIVLLILTLSIIGYVFYDIYGLNYFIVNRYDKIVMKNTIIVSVIGFVIAYPLIHFYGIVGAALNLCLTRLLMGLTLKYKWYINEKY